MMALHLGRGHGNQNLNGGGNNTAAYLIGRNELQLYQQQENASKLCMRQIYGHFLSSKLPVVY